MRHPTRQPSDILLPRELSQSDENTEDIDMDIDRYRWRY